MAASRFTDHLSQKMDKISVNDSRRADAPRYTPPHRKYAQASKSSDTATPINHTIKHSPAPIQSNVDAETVTTANGQSTVISQPQTAAASEQEIVSKPNPAARAMAPHRKHNKTTIPSSTTTPSKTKEVADSWEEEEEEEAAAATSNQEPSASPTTSLDPKPTEPPTPALSSSTPAPVPKSTYLPPHLKYRSAAPSPPTRSTTPPSRTSTPSSTSASSERRPEKTNAVAHRLIAGALGVKVPRRTEEQRAYDKAIREQERKKRDLEREAKKKAEEEAIRAKAAIWDD